MKRKVSVTGCLGVIALLPLLLLTACATVGPATTSGECHLFKPITTSVKDTQPTKQQVFAHNAVGSKECGWTPTKK